MFYSAVGETALWETLIDKREKFNVPIGCATGQIKSSPAPRFTSWTYCHQRE